MYKKNIRLKKSDLIVGALFLIVCVAIYYRVEIGLNYNWNWGKIPQFLYRFDEESGKWVSNVLMWGLFNTIRLSIFGTILAIILGTIMGICRSSKVVFFRLISGTYVETMRNLPPLVIIFLVYFFIGNHLLPYSASGRCTARPGQLPGNAGYLLPGPAGAPHDLPVRPVHPGNLRRCLYHRNCQGRDPVHSKRPVGSSRLSGHDKIPTDEIHHTATGLPAYSTASGRPIHFPDQGLIHRFGYFHSRTILQGQ